MEQIIIVDGNGIFRGDCPKCGKWRVLEFAHNNYAAKKHTLSSGMYLCHSCNMAEKKVNPEKTYKERQRLAKRDYNRRTRVALSQNFGEGRRVRFNYNVKTGSVQITEIQQRTIWSGNVGTDYPEILYVIDGEIEEEI